MTDDNVPNDPIEPTEGIDPALPATAPMPATEPVADAHPPLHDPAAPAGAQEQVAAHWYDDRAVVGAVIAAGLLGLFLLIGWLVWWSDDDEQDLVTASTTTAVIVEGSTVTSPSTIPPATITEGSTVVATLPSTTVPATTVAPTTAPATTVAETTTTVADTTTTVAETTTTVAETTTTVAATTTTVPVVTVPPAEGATAFDIIANSPDLSRLNQLIVDAGLDEELDGEGPFTLFAPSNPAIDTLAAAPGGAELLADPDRLRALLLRHVVPESLTAADVFARTELSTANGDPLTVDADAQTVDGATLLVVDVAASNGIIQVVDQVLLPA